MRYYKLFILSLLSVMFLTYSCKKDTNDTVENIQSAKDNAFASTMFDDVFKQVDDASKEMDENLMNTKLNKDSVILYGQNATITVKPLGNNFPKYINVDFGDTNTLCQDGRERRGEINYEISDWYRKTGCVINVTVQDYYVNDHKIEGLKTITNEGFTADSNRYYSVVVNNGQITKINGDIISWATNRVNEWVSGETTVFNPWDDEYLISGASNGTNANGNNFTITITDSLDVRVSCRWIRAGEIKIESGNNNPIYVDYGNGNCDADATATINGNSYNFVMN
ncbi:MAG: hypothetical protein K9H84_04240 [Bacteroidales bacterium]|nr:hypothetical protein [Bacteroidales bacterium]